jgi:hypothetical protein
MELKVEFRGSYRRPTSFSMTWALVLLMCYLVYLGLQIYYFHRLHDWILEFILMGFMSVSIAVMIPRFQVRTLSFDFVHQLQMSAEIEHFCDNSEPTQHKISP